MIKAYNETGVANLDKQSVLTEWRDNKMLTNEQLNEATKLFPVPFYQPNISIKIGLFIFTIVVILAGFGFLSIFVFDNFISDTKVYSYFCLGYGITLFFLAELFIKKNKLYRSGTDNALLYATFAFLLAFFLSITEFDWQAWTYCLVLSVALLPVIARYGDPLLSIFAYVNFIVACFLLTTKTELGKAIVPFVIMAVSALVYYLANQWRNRKNTSYYTDCQEVISTFALLTLYLGGNYAVVREGNAILYDLPESKQIDLAALFYIFTALVPALLIAYGIMKRERKAVIIGLVTTTISVITFLHYFSTWPGEFESTAIGAATIITAVLIIRYLKTSRSGITSKPDNSQNPQNLEALLISQIVPENSGQADNISGGDFGGGGAGSAY
jgi:hypothetical protein